MGSREALLAHIARLNELQDILSRASQQLLLLSRSAHDMLAAALATAPAPPPPTAPPPASPRRPAPLSPSQPRAQLAASTAAHSTANDTTRTRPPSTPPATPRRPAPPYSTHVRRQLAVKTAVRSVADHSSSSSGDISSRALPPAPPTADELDTINRIDERFEVKEAGPPYTGLGLFARTAVNADELILYYEGERLNDAEAAARYGTNRRTGLPAVPPQYVLQPKAGLYIDATHQPLALARYINHAPRKKATARYTVNGTVRSSKRIAAGQQVTADYGQEAVRLLRSAGLLPPPPPKARAPRKRKRLEKKRPDDTDTDDDDARSASELGSGGAKATAPATPERQPTLHASDDDTEPDATPTASDRPDSSTAASSPARGRRLDRNTRAAASSPERRAAMATAPQGAPPSSAAADPSRPALL